MDIKNVSCGNLTTSKGCQGRGASGVARKAQAGRVRGKAGTREREEERRREMIVSADTVAYENFYDFYALAPAHLEIRFNSLNFKKLPPLSLTSSARPRFLILFHRPPPPAFPLPPQLFAHPRPTSPVSSVLPRKQNCAALHC